MDLMPVYSEADYREAIVALYPVGSYWDDEFSDENSDLSLYVSGLAALAYRQQKRMSALLEEAFPDKTIEMITDYERMLELESTGSLAERQNKVVVKWVGMQFRPVDWNKIGEEFSFQLELERPHTWCCGNTIDNKIWGIGARSYLSFTVIVPAGTSEAVKTDFENRMKEISQDNFFIEYRYEEA